VLLAQRRLQQVLCLTPELAARAVAETLDTLQLDVDAYIALRHAELQQQGLGNDAIYSCIADELPTVRFVAKRLTSRQIRRRIYG
jgi:hypothetical protein